MKPPRRTPSPPGPLSALASCQVKSIQFYYRISPYAWDECSNERCLPLVLSLGCDWFLPCISTKAGESDLCLLQRYPYKSRLMDKLIKHIVKHLILSRGLDDMSSCSVKGKSRTYMRTVGSFEICEVSWPDARVYPSPKCAGCAHCLACNRPQTRVFDALFVEVEARNSISRTSCAHPELVTAHTTGHKGVWGKITHPWGRLHSYTIIAR